MIDADFSDEGGQGGCYRWTVSFSAARESAPPSPWLLGGALPSIFEPLIVIRLIFLRRVGDTGSFGSIDQSNRLM